MACTEVQVAGGSLLDKKETSDQFSMQFDTEAGAGQGVAWTDVFHGLESRI